MSKTTEAPEFTISGIENITRRDFLIGGAAVMLPGGCGNSGGSNSSVETRTFETPAGPVEVPVNPQRVVPGYATDIFECGAKFFYDSPLPAVVFLDNVERSLLS
ncbi:MAG: hypothetical protein ACR2KW_03255 [Rubrobacter sp.]